MAVDCNQFLSCFPFHFSHSLSVFVFWALSLTSREVLEKQERGFELLTIFSRGLLASSGCFNWVVRWEVNGRVRCWARGGWKCFESDNEKWKDQSIVGIIFGLFCLNSDRVCYSFRYSSQ